VYAAWSGAGAWLEGRELADPAELDALDLPALGAGLRPRFGEPVRNLFLVCTNGKHNVCCARLGAPLARALRDGFGDAVWETTHLGGDRYSANMVCLPDGLYYGDLALADALTAARRYVRGEVWLERYRGRAGLPQPAQAAEHFLRAHSGTGSISAVTIESVAGGQAAGGQAAGGQVAGGQAAGGQAAGGQAAGGQVTEVVAGLAAERYLVRVERVRLDPCGQECTECTECTTDAMTYVLKELTRL
jgi:hypothetical protein